MNGLATLGTYQTPLAPFTQQNGKSTIQAKPLVLPSAETSPPSNLLTGTEFAPRPDKYVLFLEEAEDDDYLIIARHLTALLQAYPNPQAVVFGRFPKKTKLTEEILLTILDKHPILKKVPVLYDLDFAHTQPLFTITTGGQVEIDTKTFSITFS